MKFHLPIYLVICTYLSIAVAQSFGNEDYDDRVPSKWYNHWADTLNDGDDVQSTGYGNNEDYEETSVDGGEDNSMELAFRKTLDELEIANVAKDDDDCDDYGKFELKISNVANDDDDYDDYRKFDLFKTAFAINLEWNAQAKDEDESGEYNIYEASQRILILDHSKEDENDDSNENTNEHDDKDDSYKYDVKNQGISCTPDNNGYICTSQQKRTTLNSDYKEREEIIDLMSNEDTSDGITTEYHYDLVQKLSSSSANSKLLTKEFSDNILDFQAVIDQTDIDLWFLILKNRKIYNDFLAIASGGQATNAYNSQQHQQLMNEMTKMLDYVDRVRGQILEMQRIEQKLNYHMLLKTLLKELYGENQVNISK